MARLSFGVALLVTGFVGSPRALAREGALPGLDELDTQVPQLAELASAALKGATRDAKELAVACHDGDQDACLALGYARGDAVYACVHAGLAYLRGEGVAGDAPKAIDLFARACSAGEGTGCRNAGTYFRDTKKDSKTAFSHFEKGCKLADTHSCVMVAEAYTYGVPVAKDLARAIALDERACGTGYAYGCMRLAVLLLAKDNPKPDPARARVLSDTACRAKLAHGCHILGDLLRDAWVAPRTHRKAARSSSRHVVMATKKRVALQRSNRASPSSL